MDPLSASCYDLKCENEFSSQILAQQKTNDKYTQILGSTVSVGSYERKNLKNLTPQILAAVVATSYHIPIGISLAFSAILLPQLQENPEFEVSKNAASWIVSIITLTTPIGSLMVGFLMDHFGRLRTLTMAAVPGIVGCILIALSQNVPMLMTGRALVGFSSGLGSSPAIVYLTEIARKDMRGSLISLAPALASLGMIVTFVIGWFFTWKQVAWITNIFIAIPCLLVFFIPESPSWLISKDRYEEAKRSLVWINKHQPQKVKVKEFLKPTGYKPVLILTGLFFFQQFSGIFIFLFYSITFFQEVGSKYNPYFTSMFIGVVRFVMSMVNTYIQRTYGRRPLMLISCFSMSLSIFFSGLFTYWIKNDTITSTWIPVVFLLLFVVASMVGVVPIPYAMTAELFPLEIRGVAHSISICMASVLMFITLQCYPMLYRIFNGICGLQYFFAAVTLISAVYVYIFLPETQGKKLSEIEDYFWKNTVYVGKKQDTSKVGKMAQRRIMRNGEHDTHLLEEA